SRRYQHAPHDRRLRRQKRNFSLVDLVARAFLFGLDGQHSFAREGLNGSDIISIPGTHSNNVRSFFWLDDDTIAKRNNSAGIGGDALTRNDDAGEIQRISRRDGNDFTGRLLVAHGAQRLDGHRQSKLLSQKAADEPPTSNLSAI